MIAALPHSWILIPTLSSHYYSRIACTKSYARFVNIYAKNGREHGGKYTTVRDKMEISKYEDPDLRVE